MNPNETPVRIDLGLVDRADSLIPVLKNHPEVRLLLSRASRASVIRLALVVGLDALERDPAAVLAVLRRPAGKSTTKAKP
jgi:hypothetical protein